MKKDNLTKAINQYVQDRISLGKASELADVSIWKFLDVMKDKKIPIRYDLEDTKREIESITGG